MLAEVAETDVVRVFDPKKQLSEEAIMKILKEADLEQAGFKKTVEISIVTDENGKKTTKKTIHYMVQDLCSRAGFWEGVLEQRLPDYLLSSKLGSTFVREIQSRIKGRKTKYCKIGLEIHPNQCATRGVAKRSKRGCSWCLFCWNAKIVY